MPVPISCVPQATRAVPSSRSSTRASAAKRPAIQEQPAIPQPSVSPSRFIEPISGLRFAQPNFSAPVVRHSFKCREEKGMPSPSSICGSLSRRSWTGSILSAMASSSIADSVANRPGTAPGPRIGVGVPTLRRASAEVTRRFGHAIHERRRLAAILLVVVEHRGVVDVILPQRRQFPSRVAPRRTRCWMRGRCPTV